MARSSDLLGGLKARIAAPRLNEDEVENWLFSEGVIS